MQRFRLSITAIALTLCSMATAQNKYDFTDVVTLPARDVKDQQNSGTCWSFSGTSFIESEMMRQGGPKIDLSEMYFVRQCYFAKIRQHIRMRFALKISQGGEAHDVLWAVKEYGIVPRSVFMPKTFNKVINHTRLEQEVISLAEDLTAQSDDEVKHVSPLWKEAVDKLLDNELGRVPETFVYENKTYTPKQFAKEVVKFDPDNYVILTSFTHHPFYKEFVMELPDNWLFGTAVNVPLDELEQIMDNALANGYTAVWGADISEDGCFIENAGHAVVPENTPDLSTEEGRKQSLKMFDINEKRLGKTAPVKEKVITQEMRQEAFDNYETTDDHGMHIIGKVKDVNGTEYYKVKNSWGDKSAHDGMLYASKAYFRYKTIDIMVHKDAIPADIRKKLGL